MARLEPEVDPEPEPEVEVVGRGTAAKSSDQASEGSLTPAEHRFCDHACSARPIQRCDSDADGHRAVPTVIRERVRMERQITRVKERAQVRLLCRCSSATVYNSSVTQCTYRHTQYYTI